MARGGNCYSTHHFYCIKCGQEGIPILRSRSSERKKEHTKKMYCIYCKTQINHIECRNQEEINSFKERFEKGEYLNAAKESEAVCNVRNSRIR